MLSSVSRQSRRVTVTAGASLVLILVSLLLGTFQERAPAARAAASPIADPAVIGLSNDGASLTAQGATTYVTQRKWVRTSTGTTVLFEQLGNRTPGGLNYIYSRNPDGTS